MPALRDAGKPRPSTCADAAGYVFPSTCQPCLGMWPGRSSGQQGRSGSGILLDENVPNQTIKSDFVMVPALGLGNDDAGELEDIGTEGKREAPATTMPVPVNPQEQAVADAAADAPAVAEPVSAPVKEVVAAEPVPGVPNSSEVHEIQDVQPVFEVDKKATDDFVLIREKALRDITYMQVIWVIIAIAIPDIVLITLFSDMGSGLKVYDKVAELDNAVAGDGLILLWVLWLCTCFCFDLFRLRAPLRLLCAFLAVVLLLAGATLKGLKYPWAPILVLFVSQLYVMADLRSHGAKVVPRSQFYSVTTCGFGIAAMLLTIVWLEWVFQSNNEWKRETKDRMIDALPHVYEHIYTEFPLNYTSHCGPDKNLTGYDEDVTGEIETACGSAATVWFLAWTVPFIVVVCNGVLCIVSFLESMMKSAEDAAYMQRVVQSFMIFITFTLTGMYCAVYVSGANVRLGSVLMAFFAAATLCLMGWIYLEVDQKQLASLANKNKVMMWVRKVVKNDWIRAVGIWMGNVFIVLFIGLDTLRQYIRRKRGISDPSGKYTSLGRTLMDEIGTWNLCRVLLRVNLLGELAFILNMGSKLTFILFSWLNTELETVDFGIVVGLVFVIGICMFLLPPVPGSAVYMFAGIVIGKQSQRDGSMGLALGVCVACILGLCAKLLACVGQYGIGYAAGKSVQIQKMIGVDKVPTRAIEMIIKKRGLNPGKVAILVGGPDWPTSVSCGILRVSIPQMLLGTLPVFVASICPQTLMGALLTKENSGEGSIWQMISLAATVVAAMGQGAATLTAMYYITRVISKHGEELAQPRPEHEKVAELTRSEKAFTDAHSKLSQFSSLTILRKVILLGATTLQLLAGLIFMVDFVLVDELCFRPFSIVNKISDSYEDDGLENNAFNIVVSPTGWGTIAMFIVAVVLHTIFTKDIARAARRQLQTAS